MERTEYQRALSLFRQAHSLDASARALVQIALAEQALERWVDAEAHLTEALRETDDPWIRPRRPIFERALRAAQAHLGYLVVDGTPLGAKVLIDGEVVGVFPFRRPLRQVEGSRQLEVRAPGFSAVERRITIAPGELRSESVHLLPLLPSPPPTVRQAHVDSIPESQSRWARRARLAAVATGLGAVALGGFSLWLDDRGTCAPVSGNRTCPKLYDTKILGFILLGTGTVVASLGGVAFFVAPAVNDRASPSAALTAVGTF